MRNTALCLGLAVSVFGAACGDEDDPVVRFDVQDVNVTTPEDTPFKVQVPVTANRRVQATVTTQPQHGTVAETEPTIYTYTPAANYNGPDTVGITFDNGLTTQVGTAHIMVTPVNDPPTAQADSFAAGFAASIDIQTSTLVMNDSDIESSPLTVTGVSAGTHGTVVMGAGKVTFMAESGFTGAATFTYQVSDGDKTAFGNVSVTVGANAAPVAVNDARTATEDTASTITVASLIANDTDADNQTLAIQTVGGATHGSVAISGANVVFTPDANYNGTASFTYQVTDGAATATGTVNLTIAAVNDAPTIVNDSGFTGTEDASLVLTAAQLLGNDSDVDGDTLRITQVSNPDHGVVSLPANAVGDTVAFVPTANYFGAAGFDYTVTDGTVTATGHVSFMVGGVNDAPAAAADTAAGMEDVPVVLTEATLLGNDTDIDGDVLTITSVTGATHGTLSQATGMVIFTPDQDYSGPATFQYTVTDGLVTSTATVTLNLAPVNDAPNALNDTLSTQEDLAVSGMVVTNDTDIDGGALTVSAVTNGAHGTVTMSGGSVTYTPATNYFGNDQFTYTSNDGAGGTSVATVMVTITPVNDSPLAIGDGLTTDEDVAAVINVLANDTDPDADSLSVTGVGTAQHGTVALVNGLPKYTPVANYNGGDTFGYTITDGQGGISTGTVTVMVKPVNDPPVALNDLYDANDEEPLTVSAALGVLKNDTDIDSTMTAVLGAAPTGGALQLNSDGSFTYTPNTCNSTDCFTYTANDGMLASSLASVCFGINHRPTGSSDYYFTYPGYTITSYPCFGQFVPYGVLCYDSDIDNDPLTASLTIGPAHAAAFQFNPDGTFVYTPLGGFVGFDSFEYMVSDGFLFDLVTVDIQVGNICAAKPGPATLLAPGVIAHGCVGPAISLNDATGAATKATAAVQDAADDVYKGLAAIGKCGCGSGSGGCGFVEVNEDTANNKAGDVLPLQSN